jgi:hypothetical protein
MFEVCAATITWYQARKELIRDGETAAVNIKKGPNVMLAAYNLVGMAG